MAPGLRVLLPLLLVAMTACVRNPATGKRMLALVSNDEEIALGKQGALDVRQSIGLLDDKKVQDYVAAVGLPMARRSERPDLPWTVQAVDDPVVNAFALPGGPVFVTRGLLTHLNSEAELASVLGHEIGHITARHSVEQLSQAQLAQLGLVVGSVISEDIAKYGGLAAAGLQLLFLKYGRDDERQADELGFRYMLGSGYDVREAADVFSTLGRVSESAGAGGLPSWLSTHPDPGERVEAARARAAKAHVDVSRLKEGREEYLAMLQGMAYGEDPRQGFFRGNVFLHPGLRFQLTFPQGWKTANQTQAVLAGSPKEDAIIGLAPAGNVAPEAALRQFLSQQGIQPINAAPEGYPAGSAYFQAQTEQGAIGGVTTFFTHAGTTLQLLAYTAAGQLASYDDTFRATFRSFGELTDPAALAVQPARIELVKLDAAMTVKQFQERYPSTIPVEEVALINGVKPEDTLPAGHTVKRVTGGVKPSP
ncbi:M48 family metalloprotease [Pyxidicoccus fallax]|uniref:M48 family metalloprotease n=1 Tax=Pyxidicoccus fallax TaxID=394095 RepID=A0A848L468_9BACT|nr:M48 family metallopeptidase [Pyxidicoccus fallax]NMO13429.1 M48 family metalloprotease [Pyxidicoccus fallax]NPC78325.1 M48 family metalloprotease [Pyxidicoccus fallax]